MAGSSKLVSFFSCSSCQQGITAHHISLFVSIYSIYESNNYANHFQVSRRKLMQLSKIHSKTTYHKCLKDLIDKGYILYEPTYHPLDGSKMIIN